MEPSFFAVFYRYLNIYHNQEPDRSSSCCRVFFSYEEVMKLQDGPEWDKHKDNEIILKLQKQVKWFQGVMSMAKSDAELLNAVYKEIGEKMGLDAAMEIYQMFKGQQISFPVRFFNPKIIRQSIIQEYDGSNVRMLAIKYGYSEKTIRRIIKESVAEK